MRRSGASTNPLAVVAIAVVLVAAGVVAATGFLTAPTAGPVEEQPIGTDAAEQYASIDGFSATKTTVVERGGETSRAVTDVRRRPGTDHRREAVRTAADRKYELAVSNGSTTWLYDSDADAVKRFSATSAASANARGEQLQRLFARLNVTDPSASASASASPAISPLPVVPSSSGPATGVNESATARTAHALTYDGTTTVDERTAYVLRIEPRDDDAAGAYRQTLWVDAERFLPLKQRTAWTDDGENVSVTTTYTNVTFDPGLPDSTFTFDPPANASVETLDVPETTTYESVRALRADAEMSVPAPDLPPSFDLTYASHTTGGVRGVGLAYANATARITVATYNRTLPVDDGDRRVTVGDRTAEVSVGPTSSVSWNCGEYRHTVRGEGVPVSLLVEVAGSVQCE
jgi:outer membrane lipoprotein-sorting protein